MDMNKLRESFKSRFKRTDDAQCWEWARKASRPDGYIQTSLRPLFPKSAYIHRISYRLFVGELIEGMQIDHLCRNRSCANPRHLEQVTLLENNRRVPWFPRVGNRTSKGRTPGWRKTVCKRGHDLTLAVNTEPYAYKGQIYQRCKLCRQIKRLENRRSMVYSG